MEINSFALNAIGQFLAPIFPSERIFVLYLITAFLLAVVSYFLVDDNHHHDEGSPEAEAIKERKERGLWRYIFDKRVFTHESTKQDLKYFAVNNVIYYGLIAQFLISVHAVAVLAYGGIVSLFGMPEAALIDGYTSLLLYTVLSVIALDIAVYVSHYAMHKIPFLWEFHKVHHSAEVLNPMTLYRMHPVDLFFTGATVALFSGSAFGLLFFLTGEEPQKLTILGLNLIVFLFYLFGYNLRHSHVWLNFPYWLNKILVSPAQHQIHHSSNPKHFDKNLGLIFSVWDRLNGTHYNPRGYEKLEFGISRKEPNPFKSVKDIYIQPFVKGYAKLKLGKGEFVGAAVVALACVAYGTIWTGSKGLSFEYRPHSVHLEELTWTEAHEALEKGYDTVLIPTGGTEQNGAHAILGKHNVVVRHTAGRIAEDLGNTLVAPVMAYVPEGAIEPKPDGHMKWTGTISLPEPIFEQVLESAARSVRAHGFRKIFFIGDSGWNQDAQQRVAERLSAEWEGSGMTVAHIGAYYYSNGQQDWLLAEGYTEDDIGTHAGIRDTSELLFVDKGTVRTARKDLVAPPEGRNWGFNGDPALASRSIGARMIQLKVDAGLESIRERLEEDAVRTVQVAPVEDDSVTTAAETGGAPSTLR